MALQDNEIFQGICSLYVGEPIEQVMAKYAIARKLNSQIEGGDAPCVCDGVEALPESAPAEKELPRKKRWSRRNLKFDPETAITQDTITCCICGEKKSVITRNHLGRHEISAEDYKRICGYPPDAKLMSLNRAAQMQVVVARAQASRLARKNAEAE